MLFPYETGPVYTGVEWVNLSVSVSSFEVG